MPWILLILLIVAAQIAQPDPAALSGPLATYAVFAVAGLFSGWALWYRAGWNAHVEYKERSGIEKAQAEAQADKKKGPWS